MTRNPTPISKEDLQLGLKILLQELKENRLEVILTEIEDGRCIRRVVSHNPVWYRALCDSYPMVGRKRRRRRKYKSDTRIRRKTIIAVLTRLIKKGRSSSAYKEDLIAIATDRITAEYKYMANSR